jgi:hypothetical protein
MKMTTDLLFCLGRPVKRFRSNLKDEVLWLNMKNSIKPIYSSDLVLTWNWRGSLFRDYCLSVEQTRLVMSGFDIGDLAVSHDWPFPSNVLDVAVDRTIEYHLSAKCMHTSTVTVLVVDLLIVGQVSWFSGVHF